MVAGLIAQWETRRSAEGQEFAWPVEFKRLSNFDNLKVRPPLLRFKYSKSFLILMKISIPKDLMNTIMGAARRAYPKEILFLLRGRKLNDEVRIEELILPTKFNFSESFSSFSQFSLPIDLSIVGSVHSHPSGCDRPSVEDMNNMYGLFMLIAKHPFRGINDIKAFDRNGKELDLKII